MAAAAAGRTGMGHASTFAIYSVVPGNDMILEINICCHCCIAMQPSTWMMWQSLRRWLYSESDLNPNRRMYLNCKCRFYCEIQIQFEFLVVCVRERLMP